MNAGKFGLTVALAVSGAAVAFPLAAPAATIEVTTTSDTALNDTECSLREAVTATNTNADVNGADDCNHDADDGPDAIELPEGVLPLLGAAGENNNATGDIDVEAGNGLTIRGDGVGDTQLNGDLDRLVHLESGKLTLRSLELTDGEAGAGEGGGILANGTGKLTLIRAKVSLSSAATGGGISLGAGSLSLSRARITDNIADGPDSTNGGGGIDFDGNNGKIDRSTVSGNSTVNGEGGGLDVTGQDGTFEITGSSFVENHADERAAGGINYDLFQGKMIVSRSLIAQNTASFAGGGLTVGNDANIVVLKSSAVVGNGVSSTNNEVIGGGGIANGGVVRLKSSVVTENTLASPNSEASLYGAGVRNDNGLEMTIRNSLISDNTAPYGVGGGIYSTQPLEVTNTTISGNGVGSGDGGGLLATLDPVVLSHVTFAANQAGDDGDALVNAGAGVTLHATIVANGADSCSGDPITSTGFNLDDAASCGLAAQGDLPSTPSKLKPLADNGGPPIGIPGASTSTLTHALRKGSQAVNHVPKGQCEDAAGDRLRLDQRGVRRPSGKRCEIGAFERGK